MIICLLGRGASGKDTLKNNLMHLYDLKELPLFTTRPKRPTEDYDAYIWGTKTDDGVYTKIHSKKVKLDDNCAEIRKYNSAHGDWYYGTPVPTITTVDGESIDMYNIKENNYIVATVPQQLKNYVDIYGKDNIALIYINCPRDVCEERIMKRDYLDKEEASRRLESDDKDYSDLEIEKICKLRINSITLFPDNSTSIFDLVSALVESNFWKNLHILETSK